MKRIILDSKSNRYFDENGYLVIKDNKIAKAGVFDYLGREISDSLPETEVYKVYRPWEELEKSAKDFEGMPLKYGHEWVQPEKRDIKIGAVSGEVKLEEPYLIADIKIYDKAAIEAITGEGIVELSPGYIAKYTVEDGEHNGEKYDFTQRDIKYNHLAIVENGRSGKDVKINDSLEEINKLERRTFTQVRSDTLPMGEGGKGERSDARTFRRIGRNQKSAAGENGIYPARFSDSSLLGQENLSSQKKRSPLPANVGDKDMSKNLKQNALYALSHAKKVYDECITSKTDDVDKRELIREIVAIAVKPDTDFQGGEEEKFRTILKKAESLGYEPSETSKTDDNVAEPDKKGTDSDIAAMKEAFNSFASLFNDFLSEEQNEGAHETHDDEPVPAKKDDDDKKHVQDSAAVVSRKTMDEQIQAAILEERKRTQDALAAYQDVEKWTGSFNMAGMSEDEIYKYAYEVLTGEKVKVQDAKPSFKAYMKAKTSDSGFAGQTYDSSDDELFTHIK